MHNILAIFRKEMNTYFTTVIAYATFGAFAFVNGLIFVSALDRFQQYTQLYLQRQNPEQLARLNFNDAIISPMFSTSIWMFLFFIPFLTMRLFAEEKSNRTFELLMSAPIRSLELVLGKFLAVVMLMACLGAIPLVFPLLLSIYGSGTAGAGGVEWTPVFSGSIAVFLLGICFCSLGMLFSSLSESQIVAALMTFAALLIAFVLPMMAGRVDGTWREILEYLAPLSHAQNGIIGRLFLKDLVYFISTTLACLILTHRVVESHRWR